jgi:hypothetical protein
VALNPNGTVTFTPTANYVGPASFVYRVKDASGTTSTNTATVSLTVTDPANQAPTAVNDGPFTIAKGTALTLTAAQLVGNDTDPNSGDTLSVNSVAPVSNGTVALNPNGTVTFTPTPNYVGPASFVYRVKDASGTTSTNTATVNITVLGNVNRPPVIGTATIGSSSSAIGTVTGTVTATDPDGDALTYTVTTGPTKGVVQVTAATGAFTYTPTVDARYTALVTPGDDTDVFAVTVMDALGAASTASVSVTVVPPAANAIDQRATNVAIHVPDLFFYTQPQIDTALDALQSTGVDTIRVLVPWAGVEPIQGSDDWSAVDRVVNSAAARNIKVLGVLNSTPTWAAVPNTFPLAGMPSDNAQFAAFAGLAAARYQGKVTAWEVWNEPNGINFWQPAPNAAQYTALLKPTYLAIKAADPNAVVVAASVGSVVDFGDWLVNPVRFVSEMYAAGAAGYFDALSFHPYQYTTPFTQGGIYYESPLTQVNRIYALMVANGDGNKKIWATEYGEPSSAAGDANQAAYLTDFLRGWRTLSFAGPAFIHTLVDNANADPAEASFGLFRADWTPKPSAAAVITVIAENDAIEAAKNASVL